jgi:hypothetical protein
MYLTLCSITRAESNQVLPLLNLSARFPFHILYDPCARFPFAHPLPLPAAHHIVQTAISHLFHFSGTLGMFLLSPSAIRNSTTHHGLFSLHSRCPYSTHAICHLPPDANAPTQVTQPPAAIASCSSTPPSLSLSFLSLPLLSLSFPSIPSSSLSHICHCPTSLDG